MYSQDKLDKLSDDIKQLEEQTKSRIDKTRDEIKQLEEEIEVLSKKISNDIYNGNKHKELVPQFIIMDGKKNILIHKQDYLIAFLTGFYEVRK